MNFDYINYQNEIFSIIKTVDTQFRHLKDQRCNHIIEQYYNEVSNLQNKMKLEIAFIGQYSAGKSTIISGLTGNKQIKIAQGVATTETKEYEWNNVFLVDTPGISTENEEHDAIAYRCMDKADLLIYTVTVNGFDSVIANDFRNIAFSQNKGLKIMLVVNKTSMESQQNRKNWIKHISEVIYPLTAREVKLTFIDAKDYIDSFDEENLEDKNELVKLSNFNEFECHLNEFIEEKGLLGRFLSPLNLIQTYIDRVINTLTTDDQETIKLQEILQQKKFTVSESKRRLERSIDTEINKLVAEILNKSTEFVTKIEVDLDAEEIETQSQYLTMQIDKFCSGSADKMEELIVNEIEHLLGELKLLENSVLARDILKSFDVDLDFSVKIKDTRLNDNMKKTPEVVKGIGKFLNVTGDGVNKWTQNAEKIGAKGLKAISGSEGHKTVLEVGHFFGKKFKPYEAQKIAAKLGKIGEKASKIGKVMGGAQVVIAPALAILDEFQENKYQNGIKEARINARNQVLDWCENIKEMFKNKKDDIIEKLHNTELAAIDHQVKQLRDKDKYEEEQVIELQIINNNLQELINSIIHKSNTTV